MSPPMSTLLRRTIFCDDDDPFVDDSVTDEDEHDTYEQYLLEHGVSMPDD